MKRLKYMVVALMLLLSCGAKAQKFSLSTNAVSWMNLATANLEFSYAPARHWTVGVGAKYNPFSFKHSGRQFQNRQQAYYLESKYWFWHSYSGWWIAVKAQWQQYNVGGITSQSTQEGDRFGGGFTAGYTHMLSPHLNLEFGLGLWAGWQKYVRYDCPVCGLTTNHGRGFFILPNDLIIGISYVF